jgi:hypothetical protein
MKLGISISIDVTKIEKARLIKGAKGTYLDLKTFIDTEKTSQYGDHGFISQSVTKEEKDAGVQTPILGNCKVFFIEGATVAQQPQTNATNADQVPFDDDIPF